MADKKAGLGPEQWLKMWENDFRHEIGHNMEDEVHSAVIHQEGCGHDHHQHDSEDHEHDTVTDEDQHGNKLKVDSFLFRNITSLTGGKTNETVFVSLCGNSPDLEWLCSRGYSVVGAELSETAVKAVFEKAIAGPIPYNVSTQGEVKIYSATDGKNLRVYIGDFFSDGICPDQLGNFNCIWDAHGIVSIPVAQQESYAKKLFTFLNPGGNILFSTVEYDLDKLVTGPAPAPVPASKLLTFFPGCVVKQLEEKELPEWELDGVEHWSNPVILVSAP